MERLLSVEEVGDLLNVSRLRVYRLVESPDPEIRIPHIRVGKHTLRFDPRQVEEWLQRRSS